MSAARHRGGGNLLRHADGTTLMHARYLIALAATADAAFVGPSPGADARAVRRGGGASPTMSSVSRNANLAKLQAGYLFPEIGRRRTAYLEANPNAQPIISLGIGDTTQPVPEHILGGLENGVTRLGNKETYTGYGAEQGMAALRGKIAEALYDGKIAPEEVFVSDGSKCDIGRLQMMFGDKMTTAVQDPSYPVYVDTSVIMGQTGQMDQGKKQYDNIVYMPCNPGNDWFPDLANTPRADVIYFCSPNNPTGAAATREQLQQLVDWANDNGSIIVFDAAYAPFIRSGDVPKSIFEIPGSRTCALEVNSFSKYGGRPLCSWLLEPGDVDPLARRDTPLQVRWLHWRPPRLDRHPEGAHIRRRLGRCRRLQPHHVHRFQRRIEHCAAGRDGRARPGGPRRDLHSDLVRGGGRFCHAAGRPACPGRRGAPRRGRLMGGRARLRRYYMGNAAMLREAMLDIGMKVHGGTDAPYVFVDLQGGSSWDTFSVGRRPLRLNEPQNHP